MRGFKTALLVLAAVLMMLLGSAVPASAAPHWSDVYTRKDCSGNGCLQIWYRIRVDYSVGFYLEGVTISTDSGGITYQGASGKGASAWNDDGVTKWRVGSADSSLNDGASRHWDLEISMPDTSRLMVGWYFEDVFVPGDDVNECTKLTVLHTDTHYGGCQLK